MAPEFDPDEILGEIRRAAFDLRSRDPAEAVRVLRRLLKGAGPAEPLVHGALGEILLEDFDDVDGSLHHFRKLVALAPTLPAGHIGLARAAARNGEADAAQASFRAAQNGLARILADAGSTPDAEHPGAEEALLTALELALEERQLLEELPTGRSPTSIPPELLAWAESTHLFDDEGGDTDDWIRFGRLLSTIQALDGRRDEALATAERVAALAGLTPDRLAYLRSCAHEAAGDFSAAGREAVAGLGDIGQGAFEAEEVLRAASLLEKAGDRAGATAVLEKLRARLEHERSRAAPDDREAIDDLLDEVRTMVSSSAPRLVGLGVGRRP